MDKVIGRVHAFVLLCLFVFSPSWALAGEKHPIIFAHGFGAPYKLYETVIPIRKIAKKMGYDLHVARTPIGGTVQERAQILNDEINRLVPHGSFHIFAHSMGGLDARLAIQSYGLGSRCLSLTTVATPHRGTIVADYFVKKFDEGAEDSRIVRWLLRIFGSGVDAIRDLTTARVEKFNAEVFDDSRVKYFSMGFYIPKPVAWYSRVPVLWFSHQLLSDAGGTDNDGMVSVDSAQWGETIGTFPSDHWSETSPVPIRDGLTYKEVLSEAVSNLERRVF